MTKSELIEIKERFESKDFLDWLEGQRLGDYDD